MTVSEEDMDFGDIDDLNELLVEQEEEEDDDEEEDEDDDELALPNDGEIIFKCPFIDWLLFHLLATCCTRFNATLLAWAVELGEFKVSWTAEAAAASWGDNDDLDDVEEKEELGEFFVAFLKLSPSGCALSSAWVIETTKTPLGTGGFSDAAELGLVKLAASDNRLECWRKLST